MAHYIGIDLGTTFSTVAQFDENGHPVIVHNREGRNRTPSVIQFTDSHNYVVGETAYAEMGYPDVFAGFIRHMGTDKTYPDDEYKSELGIQLTPKQLSALLLKKLKQDTESALNGALSDVVVTIPANFSNKARESTLWATKQAGLNIKYIINKPTATALYYAFASSKDLNGTYVVYDLGDDTFDVSVVRITNKDVEMLATEGVQKLGGDDFDKALWQLVADTYKAKTGQDLDKRDYKIIDAESDKKGLSAIQFITKYLNSTGGRASFKISRADFIQACSTYITQTELLCESVMQQAKLTVADIDDVFLAGGSTRMPWVSDSIQKIFKKSPKCHVNPDEVVALGACLYVAYKSDGTGFNNMQKAIIGQADVTNVTNITGKYLGIILGNEKQNRIIIAKGENIPCTKSETYYTDVAGQTAFHLQITESSVAETDPEFVNIVWKGHLPLPSGRPAGQEILIEYSYDTNQIMHCTFTDVATGKKTEVDLSMNKSGTSTYISMRA